MSSPEWEITGLRRRKCALLLSADRSYSTALLGNHSFSPAVTSLSGCVCVSVQFLGLHVHGDGHDHDHSEENLQYVYKLLVLLAGVYLFFLMESIFSIITRSQHQHGHEEVCVSCFVLSRVTRSWADSLSCVHRRSLRSITAITVESCRCSSERSRAITPALRPIWWERVFVRE